MAIGRMCRACQRFTYGETRPESCGHCGARIDNGQRFDEAPAGIVRDWSQINKDRPHVPTGFYTQLGMEHGGFVRSARDVQRLHDRFNRREERRAKAEGREPETVRPHFDGTWHGRG